MAKEIKIKKVKEKDTGFNIAYRVVTALMAAATFPVVIFSSLFYLAYTIPFWNIISSDSSDTGASYFKASIYELLTEYKGFADLLGGGKTDWSEQLAALKTPFITVISLYAAVCVLALVIILLAAFTRKKLPIIITAVLGFGTLSAIPFAFKALEAPFADGTINIDTFLQTGLSSIMSMVVTFDFLKAGDAYVLLWVVFVAIIVWTLAVMLVNSGDKPKKKAISEE